MTDNEKLDLILSEIQNIKSDTQELKQEATSIRNKVASIELMLENEIRVNIQRVAEGHLDLSRNLHEAIKIDNEKEMLAIRVNILETELRKVKERIENIA